MKRSLLLCSVCAALMALMASQSQADDLRLTLDLQNTNKANANSGGVWKLYARVVDTAGPANGSTGIAGLRALVDNISTAGIVFNNAINANGAANSQVIAGDPQSTVEVVYGQDLSQATTAGVGVPPGATPNLDVLIAQGTWPAGARPVFGNDNPPGIGPFLSDGGFLAGAGNPAVAADNIVTAVVTLADYNGSNTVSFADISGLVADLQGGPDNPAGDINQSGTITFADIAGFVAILNGPLSAATAVPEPSTMMLLLGSVSLLGLRRRG